VQKIARCLLVAVACASISACGPKPPPEVTATPNPAVAPTAKPTPLVVAMDAPPQIVAIDLASPVFHSNETVTGAVITTTNVQTVSLELGGRVMDLPKVDDGRFGMSYHVPQIPFFMKHAYTVHVVSKTATGAQATRDVTVWLQ